ncbi:MAG: fatty acid desaturase [Bacteroidota bacterium]|nr:fatty acid desaturase [Bacteroidota bacterium]
MKKQGKYNGIFVAGLIISCWFSLLVYLLNLQVNYNNLIIYIFILLQTHLYTGLFITAHDAMHGVVSKNRKLNKIIGNIAALLFAFNFYNKLIIKHHEHHRFVGSDKDPDYHEGPFFVWYFNFLKQYITWYQILLMAVTYNLLALVFPRGNLVLFWIVPSLLSTFQLFFFGTYLPHRGDHAPDNKHKSRSFQRNHFLAFITCYFFGYHYEHHDSPSTPWWQLYKAKR